MKQKKFKTIREFVDFCQRGMEEYVHNPGIVGSPYPRGNQIIQMKATPEEIREIFENAGGFQLKYDQPSEICRFNMTYIPENTDVLIGNGMTEEYNILGAPPGWTGLSLHPDREGKEDAIAATNVLEKILLIAEENKVPMGTPVRDRSVLPDRSYMVYQIPE